ncbi:MAG TPA: crossover junction endodeoxyribonuclease RuvC [Candidatus Paceibacterota bacterium]
MRILAFDPGFERLGTAVLEKTSGRETLIHSSCIRTPKELPFSERLQLLGQATEALIAEHAPKAVALESLYFENNAKTAINVAAVRGILSYIAAVHHLPVYEYTPLQVKIAVTGYGKSDKAAVAAMVPRLIALPERKRLDDEIDAIAVGLTCLASIR